MSLESVSVYFVQLFSEVALSHALNESIWASAWAGRSASQSPVTPEGSEARPQRAQRRGNGTQARGGTAEPLTECKEGQRWCADPPRWGRRKGPWEVTPSPPEPAEEALQRRPCRGGGPAEEEALQRRPCRGGGPAEEEALRRSRPCGGGGPAEEALCVCAAGAQSLTTAGLARDPLPPDPRCERAWHKVVILQLNPQALLWSETGDEKSPSPLEGPGCWQSTPSFGHSVGKGRGWTRDAPAREMETGWQSPGHLRGPLQVAALPGLNGTRRPCNSIDSANWMIPPVPAPLSPSPALLPSPRPPSSSRPWRR
ncbi:unnamed protein product [Lota lota]